MYFLSQTYRQFYPNTYTYQYDANGNMVLDSIGRVMKDGHLEEDISKRQLLWDEENRLLAINDNGYVSSYLYNANGERTVKLSGNNEAVYVNTIPSANETQTDRFTIYPSPYIVFTNGGRYTKHIYIGSERIVSKVAIDNGYDPRTTPTAAYGNNIYVTRLNNKSTALNDSIEAIYTKFQLPFNGLNNDDIIQGFQPSLMNRAYTMSTGIDNYEEYSYYIHSDHLGSTSYITNSDGEVSQHVEYVPFGEVFIEELSSSAKLNTPYLFNGKELDEETGLYYYGARYYDPRTSLWLSTDPMELKYPNISSYAYCANNPITFIDPSGSIILLPKGTSIKNIFLTLGTLQKLTNDKLVYSTQKDGSIRIKIASLGTGTKTNGTNLIRRLNSSKKTVTIDIQNSQGYFSKKYGNRAKATDYTNAANGVGSDAIVNFDPESNPLIYTVDPQTGRVYKATRPNQVGLGHELIHAEHYMDGDYIPPENKSVQTYFDSNGTQISNTVKTEELRTIGTKKIKKDDIYENQLRKEQNIRERGAY